MDWKKLKKDPTFKVNITSVNGGNDENNQNNTLITTAQLPLELPSTFKLYIHTNNVNRAHENAFTIADTHGKVFYSDGDFTDNTEYSYDINLKKGCYQFLFTDKMEDGISLHWWYRNSNPDKMGINGSVKIISTDGEELHKLNPDFGQELRLNFVVD